MSDEWAACPACGDGGDPRILQSAPPKHLMHCANCRRRYDAVRPPCPDGGHDWVECLMVQSSGNVLRKCWVCGARG